jgi:hypothetical protein
MTGKKRTRCPCSALKQAEQSMKWEEKKTGEAVKAKSRIQAATRAWAAKTSGM